METYFKKNTGILFLIRVIIVKGVFKSLFDELTFGFQNNKNNKSVLIMSFNSL